MLIKLSEYIKIDQSSKTLEFVSRTTDQFWRHESSVKNTCMDHIAESKHFFSYLSVQLLKHSKQLKKFPAIEKKKLANKKGKKKKRTEVQNFLNNHNYEQESTPTLQRAPSSWPIPKTTMHSSNHF